MALTTCERNNFPKALARAPEEGARGGETSLGMMTGLSIEIACGLIVITLAMTRRRYGEKSSIWVNGERRVLWLLDATTGRCSWERKVSQKPVAPATLIFNAGLIGTALVTLLISRV